MMKHCIRCVMPNTRPGIQFNEDGVCFPCLSIERRKTIHWGQRWAELEELCELHKERHKDKPYDCVIAVSGGKDSHYQTHVFKELLGMRPLLVTVGDWWTHTQCGMDNFENICNVFSCDSFMFRQSPELMRKMMRIAFFEVGSPTWAFDAAIYSIPLRMAEMMGIQLVNYGENVAFSYGGTDCIETHSARRQIDNDVVKPLSKDWWLKRGVELPTLLQYPNQSILDKLEPIYLSYFVPWSGYNNYQYAMTRGFRDATGEWERLGYIDNYDQIDSIGLLAHEWLKYPKFGHRRVTDMASNLIRDNLMTRDEAVELVLAKDHLLEPTMLNDFCRFLGISHDEFYEHVETLYNLELFDKIASEWVLKNPITKLKTTG